jgi:hypothetical protein
MECRVESAARPKVNCRYCGATQTYRLGLCSVCALSVCETCGNVQYAAGERKVTHRECLRSNDDGFKMIKFVR